MHHPDHLGRSRIEADTGLFLRLAADGGKHGFIAIKVTGHHAVVAIFVAGIEPAQEEDLTLAEEEEVDGDRGGEPVNSGHGMRPARRLRASGRRRAWPPARTCGTRRRR